MLAYLIRRIGYGGLVVLGVLFFLFSLFFLVTTPDDIARRAVGDKAMPQVIERWKVNHGYDRPLWPGVEHPRDNLLVDHFEKMLTFDFGKSDADGVPLSRRIREGALPSLLLTTPMFVLGVLLAIGISLVVALFRESYLDRLGVFWSVLGMSVPLVIYIIAGQFVFGRLLRWFPISGFDWDPQVLWRFLAMPVVIGLLAGLGSDVRFFRTVFIEEINRDYVRTARAKGAGELRVLGAHVLRNALIPVLTNVVMAIPFLFTGSLLLEAAFGIPGLGSLTVEAINANDFATLRAMVFLDSLILIGGQILTDLSYTWVDPRVRLD
ncbi:MAG TPA: ABC transporter permease [Polyangiaceae bacterium]|nr:ABC transporter permease [Polyangiaceae bacterium]